MERRRGEKMDKKKRERFRRLLLKERERVLKEIENLEDEISSEQKELSGSSGYSYHPADIATDDYNREFNLGLASTEGEILYQIERALEKMETGEYGKCEDCKKEIDEERLKSIPYARFCIQCQKKREK